MSESNKEVAEEKRIQAEGRMGHYLTSLDHLYKAAIQQDKARLSILMGVFPMVFLLLGFVVNPIAYIFGILSICANSMCCLSLLEISELNKAMIIAAMVPAEAKKVEKMNKEKLDGVKMEKHKIKYKKYLIISFVLILLSLSINGIHKYVEGDFRMNANEKDKSAAEIIVTKPIKKTNTDKDVSGIGENVRPENILNPKPVIRPEPAETSESKNDE